MEKFNQSKKYGRELELEIVWLSLYKNPEQKGIETSCFGSFYESHI